MKRMVKTKRNEMEGISAAHPRLFGKMLSVECSFCPCCILCRPTIRSGITLGLFWTIEEKSFRNCYPPTNVFFQSCPPDLFFCSLLHVGHTFASAVCKLHRVRLHEVEGLLHRGVRVCQRVAIMFGPPHVKSSGTSPK